MLSAERTSIKAALTKLASTLSAGSNFAQYITRWQNDVDAEYNGHATISAVTTGVTVQATPVSTVALLPSSPATNDEAIVTDANAVTNGTTVAGGGAGRVLVRYDGTNWKIV